MKNRNRILPALRIASMFPRALAIILCMGGSLAQQNDSLRSQANVVLMPTLVEDTGGHVVYGLTQNDFVILDDAAEQTVHLDDSPESDPVSVVVAIQTGLRAKREFPRMRGIGSMLNPVFSQAGSRVALVEFDSQVNLVEDFRDDETAIDEDLKNLRPGDNGAAIRDAVKVSVNLLEKEPNARRRILLLVCENRDHGSRVAKTDNVVAAVGVSNNRCVCPGVLAVALAGSGYRARQQPGRSVLGRSAGHHRHT